LPLQGGVKMPINIPDKDKKLLFPIRRRMREEGIKHPILEYYEGEEEWLQEQRELEKKQREEEIEKNLKLLFAKRRESKN